MKKTCLLLLAAVLLVCTLTLTACSGGEKKDTTNGTFEIQYYLYNDVTAALKVKVVDGKFNLSMIPTKHGYTFMGLFDAPEGGTKYVNEAGASVLNVTSPDLVLHAQWAPQNFFISFDAGEGSLAPEQKELTVAYGSTLTAMPVPEKDGYTFIGWADANGTLYSNAGTVIGSKQVFQEANYPTLAEGTTMQLYAQYELRQHKVTLDYNDGSYRVESFTVKYGEPIPESKLPTQDTGSSELIGWSLSNSSTVSFSGNVTSDITLYAIWKDYRVFTLNDMTGMTQTLKVYRGETVDLSTVNVDDLRPGYRAEGWYTNTMYSGNPITELNYGSTTTMLYAKWALATYTLRFDAASAGTEFAEITYQMGDTKDLPVLTKAGHIFNGWCTKADCSDTPITKLSETMYGDHTLYACFTPEQYTVTLHGMGGNLTSTTQKVEFQTTYKLPVPTRDGYEFLGWYDADATNARKVANEKGESLSPYGWYDSIDLYARWDVQKFTLTFETDGGSAVASIQVKYNDNLTLPADPTKENMLLDGWYNKDFTESYTSSYKVTSDITLYAKWIQSTAISTADELKAIATNPTANYHLTQDINLKGAKWDMIPEFSGTLNGKGFKIHNFSIVSESDNSGFVQINKGKICNLTFSDITVSASHSSKAGFCAGLIAGENAKDAVISNCTVTDASSSYYTTRNADKCELYAGVGAIAGMNYGTIDGCNVDYEINGNQSVYDNAGNDMVYDNLYVGLVCGDSYGIIKNCQATGHIVFQLSSTCKKAPLPEAIVVMGGIVGVNNDNGSVYNCHSDAVLEVSAATAGVTVFCAGGCVGRIDPNAVVSACSASGTIKDTSGAITTTRIGGFVYMNDGTVDNCYTTVSIELASAGNDNSYVGGFVHMNRKSITSSYCTGNVVTKATAGTGGFAGYNTAGSTISKCFTASNLTTPSAEKVGYFVGVAEGGSMVTKCYYSNEMKLTIEGGITAIPTNTDGTAEAPANLQGEELIYNTLSWDSSIWLVKKDQYPTLLWQE